MRLLILADYYFPGYKAGGPIQSIYNLVSAIEQETDVYIVTRDRDSGDKSCYQNIHVDTWNTVNDHSVFYVRPSGFTVTLIEDLMSEVNPDAIHLNSFFSPWSAKTFMALIRRRLKVPVFMSVRGEFGAAALATKASKKKIYITLFKTVLKRFNKVIFIATNSLEANAIRSNIGQNETIYINANSGKSRQEMYIESSSEHNEIRFVTVARISPIKNLIFFADVLRSVNPKENIVWTIYGRVGEDSRLQELQESVEKCTNVHLDIMGAIPNHEILSSIRSYDFFVLPTLGENFGHAIYDSFLAGVPVLISDKTPWRDLKIKRAGWDLPLELPVWRDVLKDVLQMSLDERNKLKKQTYIYGSELIDRDETGKTYLEILEANI